MSTGDVVTLDDGTRVEVGPRVRPVLHLASPLVAAAAVWAARRGIRWAYQGATGRTAPAPRDPLTSWRTAILWAAVTGSTAAVIDVTVHRLGDERAITVLRRGRGVFARRHS